MLSTPSPLETPGAEPRHDAAHREIGPPIELGLPYWFHLFFPDRALTTSLRILVVGCGDDLALRLARANPHARITAVDERPAALENAERSQQQRLPNLEIIPAWPSTASGGGFDLIYYDTASWPQEPPRAVLSRAAELLGRQGSLHLTLRAKYAWAGVRSVRELLERLGIEPNSEGYPLARQVVAALAPNHPWNLLAPGSSTRPDDLLADWLHPEAPCFSVPEAYDLLAASGLALQRFTYQPYYLPQCSPLGRTPLLAEARKLPEAQQHALMELYWPGVRYHFLAACRADRPPSTFQIDFSSEEWLCYGPLLPARLPLEEETEPVGAKARLRWRAAGMPEVGFSLGGFQFRLLKALDRAEELGEVIGLASFSGDPQLRDQWAREFFQMMWDYDFLHFRISRISIGLEETEDSGAVESHPEPQRSLVKLAQVPLEAAEQPPIEAEAISPPATKEQTPTTGEQLRPEAEKEPSREAETQRPASPPLAIEPTLPVALAVQVGRSAARPPEAPAAAWQAAEYRGESGEQPERVRYEACPLCEELGYESFRNDQAELALGQRVVSLSIPWVRCVGCGHLFTAGYFAGDIRSRILEAALECRGNLQQAVAARSQASRIVAAITALREQAGGRWLDVGCSQSGLAAMATEFGYESVGLDCSAQAAQRLHALGYDVRAGSLFDCHNGPFDVVSLSGVIAQMPFPAQALRHAQRLLGKCGLLFVSAPSRDSLGWRNLDLDGNNPYWARLDLYHAFHRKTLFRLLRTTGFEPCDYGAGGPAPVGMEVIACKS
jgi:2-polyprenyl-3-methyl-5-hydroxy-6-metoxy-1,4-benzoquinol methylase